MNTKTLHFGLLCCQYLLFVLLVLNELISFIKFISKNLSICISTHRWQHFHEAQQIDEHHARCGDAKLHFQKGDGAFPIAPNGQQDEKGAAALQQAEGAAHDHKDGPLGRMRLRRLK